MTIRSDHKALLFVGAIAVLGAGVRVARAFGGGERPQQPALERQMQSADSARRAGGKRRPKTAERGRVAGIATPTTATPGDRRAYVGSRLDLDVATAAQIDSLPGMSPTIAKRIAADRMAHGPFTSLARLSRVKGVTTRLLQKLDTLVVFSGTIAPPNANDTLIQSQKRRKQKDL